MSACLHTWCLPPSVKAQPGTRTSLNVSLPSSTLSPQSPTRASGELSGMWVRSHQHLNPCWSSSSGSQAGPPPLPYPTTLSLPCSSLGQGGPSTSGHPANSHPAPSEASSMLLFGSSESLRPHGLQHASLPCPSPSPRACSNSCPWNRWCHPTILSFVSPFFSFLQSFPASGFFPMSWLFTSGGPKCWSFSFRCLLGTLIVRPVSLPPCAMSTAV